MKLRKYNFTFVNGKFITKRKFSLWQELIFRNRRYCPECDSIEYFTDGDMSICGPSCARCGYNRKISEIINENLSSTK